MAKKYPESVIQQAKTLFEKGFAGPKIAKQLDIKRVNTVYEWVKKFDWKKISDYKDFKDQEVVWKDVAKNALEYLKGKGFTSMKDALNVFERATAHLESLKKEGINPQDVLSKILGDEPEKDIPEDTPKGVTDNEDQ